jgi:UDPglucose--hexose-1-phosphate uridylyltransferase
VAGEPQPIGRSFSTPHRRFNPLSDEWVLVSAQRTQRPWQGAEQPPPTGRRARYEPDCYLCPGNVRASGEHNPAYGATFAFTNDFPALEPADAEEQRADHPLLRAHSQPGTCRVLCFSPRHDLTLADMPEPEIRGVVESLPGKRFRRV